MLFSVRHSILHTREARSGGSTVRQANSTPCCGDPLKCDDGVRLDTGNLTPSATT